MRRRRATWTVFAACVVIAAALLAWITVSIVRLEAREARAQARADHEAAVGTALWQMDGWLLPLLAEEAQRPPADYVAFRSLPDAYTNLYGKLSPGAVMTPSPLLTWRSDLFPLHFQVDDDGTVTSPQVPLGTALDVAQSQAPPSQIEGKRALLQRMSALLTPKRLSVGCSAGVAALPERQIAVPGSFLDNYEQRAKVTGPARNVWNAQNVAESAPQGSAAVGTPLVPMWLDDPAGGDCLVFVRRVQFGDRAVFQGVLADWPTVAAGLLAAITDPEVREGARLVRVDHPDAADRSRMLTVVPAALLTQPPSCALPAWSPARSLLAAAWGALVLGSLAALLTLRATLRFADRRARFASAVTHELRTPLTTFRMYSEMLAKDMVTDEARRRHYLATLHAESDRLARLVENVLGYARIEEGRFTARVEPVDLAALIARVRPVLARRAAEAGADLTVDLRNGDARVEVDCDAVGQILFNLVDNACKYGKPPFVLTARTAGKAVELTVADHGPGIPRRYRTRIFTAFDRGSRPIGDNEVPGVGLGLALARGLARDLGGDLVLDEDAPGARFVVTLPPASR